MHQHIIPRDSRTPSGIDPYGAGSESGGSPDNNGKYSGGIDYKTLYNSEGGGKQTNPINVYVMYCIRYKAAVPSNYSSQFANLRTNYNSISQNLNDFISK